MGQKLVVYAQRAGVIDLDLIARAYNIAIQPRLEFFSDVFHHDMLHPARNALILIEQAGCRDPHVLAAAIVTETLYPEVRVSADALGNAVHVLADQVPNPLDDVESLVERLVTAERDVGLIAVAERLDHARHLHMRPQSEWPGFYDGAVSVYLPLAERVDEDLFRRFQRWAGAFQNRLS